MAHFALFHSSGDQLPLTVLADPLPIGPRARRTWRIVAVTMVVAFYLLGLSADWWVGKDSGLYLCLARSLARGEGYTLAGRPHVFVPPGFPLMLAGLMKIGLGSFLGINAAMMVLGLASAMAAYLLLAQLVDRDWAALLAIVFAFSEELLRNSGQILSDVPFTLVVTAGLWLYARGLRQINPDRRGWELGTVLLASSCLLRVVGGPIAVAAPVGLLLSAWSGLPSSRWRAVLNLVLMLALVGAGAAAGWAYFHAHPNPLQPNYVQALHEGLMNKGIVGNLAATTENFSRLIIQQTLPVALAVLLLAVPVVLAMVRRVLRGEWLAAAVVVGYVGGICVLQRDLLTRYQLPLMPLLLLCLFEGYAFLVGRLGAVHARRFMVSLAAVILAFNVIPDVRTIHQKHWTDWPYTQGNGAWRNYRLAARFLLEMSPEVRPPPGSVILAPYSVSFLADIPAPSTAASISRMAEADRARLLRDLHVRYVVIVTGPKDAEDAADDLAESMQRGAGLVFQAHNSQNRVRVFAVKPDGTPS